MISVPKGLKGQSSDFCARRVPSIFIFGCTVHMWDRKFPQKQGPNQLPLKWKQGALTTGIAEKTPCVALDEELSALIQVLFSLTVHILL